MSLTLYKSTLKRNWLLLVIFLSVLLMYLSIMIFMYNPDDIEAITSMLDLFPEDLMKAMGFSTMITDMTSYLASWLYGLLMFGFPMVYCIILSNRLVAKMVDNSSFAYLLSTPNSRLKIILTQGIYALDSLIVLFTIIFGIGVLISSAVYPGELDIMAFLLLNVTTMLVNMTVMMICFFFSCLFNESRKAIGLGAGISISFFLLNMLGGVSQEASFLKNISIYGWYDPVDLVKNGNIWPINTIYIALCILLFAGSVIVFRKKRLPL